MNCWKNQKALIKTNLRSGHIFRTCNVKTAKYRTETLSFKDLKYSPLFSSDIKYSETLEACKKDNVLEAR